MPSTHKDILNELFESPVKVKALKLFIRNPGGMFTIPDAARRLAVNTQAFANQVKKLLAIGFLKSRKAIVVKKFRGRSRKRRVLVFAVNPAFEFSDELRNLILRSQPTQWEKRLRELEKLGRMKLALACGALVGDDGNRIDVLLVGDKLRARRVRSFMKSLEADVGKELRYVTLPTKEFAYRYRMFDNFLRDIFERPHKKLINRLRALIGSS